MAAYLTTLRRIAVQLNDQWAEIALSQACTTENPAGDSGKLPA